MLGQASEKEKRRSGPRSLEGDFYVRLPRRQSPFVHSPTFLCETSSRLPLQTRPSWRGDSLLTAYPGSPVPGLLTALFVQSRLAYHCSSLYELRARVKLKI